MKNTVLKLSKVNRGAGAAGMASTTRGRSRVFVDRKKQANKYACRNGG